MSKPKSIAVKEKLTPQEQKGFDLMEIGEWYCESGVHGKFLHGIRRHRHVFDRLHEKGFIECKVCKSKHTVPYLYAIYRRAK